jgi:hypothetical protein
MLWRTNEARTIVASVFQDGLGSLYNSTVSIVGLGSPNNVYKRGRRGGRPAIFQIGFCPKIVPNFFADFPQTRPFMSDKIPISSFWPFRPQTSFCPFFPFCALGKKRGEKGEMGELRMFLGDSGAKGLHKGPEISPFLSN